MAVVLPQQNRHGTFTSASVVVPTPPGGEDGITIALDLSPADLASTKSLSLYVEASPDGGQTWHYVAGIGWTGPATVQPDLTVGIAAWIGQRVRCIVDIPQTMRVGASIDWVTIA